MCKDDRSPKTDSQNGTLVGILRQGFLHYETNGLATILEIPDVIVPKPSRTRKVKHYVN